MSLHVFLDCQKVMTPKICHHLRMDYSDVEFEYFLEPIYNKGHLVLGDAKFDFTGEKKQYVVGLFIDNFFSWGHYAEVLAHELRHIWQFKNDFISILRHPESDAYEYELLWVCSPQMVLV